MGKSYDSHIGDMRGLLTLSRAELGNKESTQVSSHALESGSGGPNHESGVGQVLNPVPNIVRNSHSIIWFLGHAR